MATCARAVRAQLSAFDMMTTPKILIERNGIITRMGQGQEQRELIVLYRSITKIEQKQIAQ